MRGSVSEDLGDPELRRSLPALADYMEEASIHLAHHSVDLEQTDGKRFFGTAPSCEANDQTEGLRHEAVWACGRHEPDYADTRVGQARASADRLRPRRAPERRAAVDHVALGVLVREPLHGAALRDAAFAVV